MKFPRAYAMLKRNGHTASKALEILIDARRGCRTARRWILVLLKQRNL